MEKRLVKVAQELNVGTSTIVEFLNGKGHHIENKPTSKVTEEMESLLEKEFSKSKAVKEQADSLTIGVRPILKKEISSNRDKEETVTTMAAPPPAFQKREDGHRAPLFKKSEPPKPPVFKREEPKPAPEPEPAPAPVIVEEIIEKSTPPAEVANVETPKIGLTIKGKIDLDKKPEPIVEEAATPTVTVDEKPAESIETPPAHVPEVEEIKPEPEAIVEAPPSKKMYRGRAQPPVDEEPAPPIVEEVTEEAIETAADPDDELVRMRTPELRGLKILGKIDINKRQDSKVGKKKKKDPKEREKERSRERERPKAGAKPDDQRPSPRPGDQRPNPGDQRSNPDDQRPKPVASSDEERRKRKRKRRQLPSTSNDAGTSTQGSTAAAPSTSGTGSIASRRRGRTSPEVSGKAVDDQIKKTMASLSGAGKKKRQKQRRETRERIRERQDARDSEGLTDKLEVTEFVTVQEIANMMNVPATEVIMACMNLGVFVSINQRLDAELIELVASEFGHEVSFISVEDQTDVEDDIEDAPEDLQPRAPIVTVMGHVDHGKTSLLDYIRNANVVSGEAGGITQHIGAYEVMVNDRSITFLDTPGHEAFTAMRARGTKVTDIAIIVIAADDNVMPQTKEAISHAQAAGVPMVFAINKIDKAGALPERIKQELASMNILVEDWGGDFQSQDISAKSGQDVDKLLEKVLLVADLAEVKANPNRPAIGTIIEASLDKGKGYVSKMLVQNGTLKIGDMMVAGEYSGKVKAMFNERGKRVKEAGPAAPVMVLGLGGAPTAGERFKVMEDESQARLLASRRAQINREQATRATKRISLDEIGRRLALGTFKELNLIVKGDVDGSVEALSDSLIKLSLETVQVKVIHKAVGQIIESDVLLASASDAIIIGFQVRPSVSARKLAEREGVEIKGYSIIYEAIEEVKLAIEGLLEPTREEKIICNIEIREVFKISKVGTVAGCYVLDGKINRNTPIRIIRDGIVIYPTKEGAMGELASLKRVKDDVKEVKFGMECGLTIKNFNDIKEGDIVEGYEVVEVKQKYG